MGFLLGVIENILKLDTVMIIELSEYTKNKWRVYKRVDVMIWELYLNKAFFFFEVTMG